jgi:hypothetical protein
MVTPWQVLGIDPTTDRRRIKKAYALRLKQFHPENDPEGFRIIRSAYEAALSWTEGQEGLPEENEKEDPTPNRAQASPRAFFAPAAEQRLEARDRVFRTVDALMKKVKALEKREDDWNSERAWGPAPGRRGSLGPPPRERVSIGAFRLSGLGET